MEKNELNQWWNIKGNYKILHKINPLRLEFILNNFDKSIKKKVLSDAYCIKKSVKKNTNYQTFFF